MSAWSDQRKLAFVAMLAQWGTTLTFGGEEAQCLADPQESAAKNTVVLEMPSRPAKFSLLREDVIRLGLQTTVGRPMQIVTNNGQEFEIYSVTDDPADATIDFRARLRI